MIKPCDAVWLCVAAIWSAASPASFQTAYAQTVPHAGLGSVFEITTEFDLDAVAAAGDLQAQKPNPVLDGRLRFDAERVMQDGRRWGFRFAAGANSGDGRRGFAQPVNTGPTAQGQALTGLATGFTAASDLDPGSGRAAVIAAELYLTGQWLEWRAGLGPTAARAFNPPPISAFRLTRSDRALVDLAGGGLTHTGLSLSAPALRVSVETRRIVGFALAASFTPTAKRCGIDQCRPADTLTVASPDIENLASIAISFDRRAPQSGVRWSADVALEYGRKDASVGGFSDPWVFSAGASRDANGVTLGLSVLHTNDGLDGSTYTAWSALAGFERGDWLYSLEAGHGRSGAFDLDGASLSAGASRWVSDNLLISFGFNTHSAGGAAAVVETGLRF